MEDLKVLMTKYRRLETERLILRPVTLKDAEDMFEYASDEETTYYVFDRHESLQKTEEAIVNYFISEPFGKYGIELKETGKMIGTIDLRVKSQDKRAVMGYTLNKQYHGKGYMTEAGERLLSFGFDTLKLSCISALHDERNAVSGKVMERLGMTKEGTLRHVAKWKQGEWFNDVYYSILKMEYDEQQTHKK
ncbi:GNAT family N-acetyltransferase [Alkalibacterium sp.]|nr:MAG: N-acetyltransferase [Alkalibacterium sp.]